jgi:HAD superfamily hydrolase (TIGR01458 family)
VGSARCVLLDIDGVLTISWRAIPGAPEAVAGLRASGWRLAMVTNTTSTGRARIVERLSEAGIPTEPEEVFTAPRAAAAYLRAHHPGASCLLVSNGTPHDDLEGVELVDPGLEQAVDVVLTGGAGPEVGYELLNRAYHALVGGASLVAMHRNLQWETEAGSQLDMGAFLLGLEQAAQSPATVVGKPSTDLYLSILGALDLDAGETVMVGDDLEADIEGAQAVGMRAVLVRTGKFREEHLRRSAIEPDDVVDSVADLPSLLGYPG